MNRSEATVRQQAVLFHGLHAKFPNVPFRLLESFLGSLCHDYGKASEEHGWPLSRVSCPIQKVQCIMHTIAWMTHSTRLEHPQPTTTSYLACSSTTVLVLSHFIASDPLGSCLTVDILHTARRHIYGHEYDIKEIMLTKWTRQFTVWICVHF
jgi:hypothetical protein